jgi:hypothetical protein
MFFGCVIRLASRTVPAKVLVLRLFADLVPVCPTFSKGHALRLSTEGAKYDLNWFRNQATAVIRLLQTFLNVYAIANAVCKVSG